jgi:hypothetical protein
VRRGGLSFRSKPQTLNFRVEVEKQGASLFLLFLLFDFDGPLLQSPWCPVPSIFD